MKEIHIQTLRNILLLIALPFAAGCSGGGGLAGLGLGSLFAAGGGGGFDLAALFASGFTGFETGGNIPVLTNPEPATMFLLGSGMAALGLMKAKKNS